MDETRGRNPAGHHADRSDEALVKLWRAHRRWVAAVVYAHKPRDADLEDLLQEVAMRLIRNIHTLDDRESIRPWLRTVAVNVARSAGRRTRSRISAHRALQTVAEPDRKVNGAGLVDQPTLARSVEDAASRGRRALELACSLPMHYREPLLLSLRGLSQKQIGHAMGLPVTTIETRLIRARRMIADELAGDESAEPRPRDRSSTLDSNSVGSER